MILEYLRMLEIKRFRVEKEYFFAEDALFRQEKAYKEQIMGGYKINLLYYSW